MKIKNRIKFAPSKQSPYNPLLIFFEAIVFNLFLAAEGGVSNGVYAQSIGLVLRTILQVGAMKSTAYAGDNLL